MSVNSYMSELASSLVLNESEKAHIETSVAAIKSRLRSYFNNLVEINVFGSYDRGTILPRKADEESDIDIMVVFSNTYSLQPQSFFNKLKDFANYYYKSSEVHQSCPTVVLELNHIKFELVPAFLDGSFYKIPKTSTTWQLTYSRSFKSELTESNKQNGYKIKPLIRLFKWWNIEKNYRSMLSFELEQKIAQELKYSYLSCTSFTDYSKKAFESLKYCTDTSRVEIAINRINKALALENEGYSFLAIDEIKKVFPGL